MGIGERFEKTKISASFVHEERAFDAELKRQEVGKL